MHQKNTTTSELAGAAQSARTSADVEALILAAGSAGIARWRDLGDRPNNAGTVQIASSPALAVVERVTNSIDGLLELQALQRGGEIPRTPREAARDWYGIPTGGIGEMTDSERRVLAENISVILEDSSDRERPTVVISDRGCGQHPDDAPLTLLSLNEGNKVAKAYLQGAYGQGASATYRFARFTVIMTRRAPTLNGGRSDQVGWTVVWEDPGDPSVDKLPVYRYLVDEHGGVPTFEPSQLEEPTWHGTTIRHVCYDLRGYTAAYNQPKNGIWALFHSALFDPVLPFLVGGTRPIDERTAGVGSTRVVIGNAARLDNPNGPRGDLEVAYANSEVYDLGKATARDLGKFTIKHWVLRRPAGGDSKTDPTASYVSPDNVVTMTLSGQRQDAENRAWLRNRVELPFLVRNLVIQIDVDGLSPVAKRDLFASTRERAVDGDLRHTIYGEVAAVLKQDPELRRLEREERDKLLAQSAEQVDDKIRDRLRKHIDTIIKGKARIVDTEAEASRPAGPGGPVRPRNTDDSHLPAVPTLLRFARNPITIRQGAETTVWVEIDAKNGYLPDHLDDLEVRFSPVVEGRVRDVAKSKLLGGRSLWKLQAAPDAPTGKFEMKAILVTANGVIETKVTIQVVEAVEKTKRRVKNEEPEKGPVVNWVRRAEWAGLGWDAHTVGQASVSDGETLILVNRDLRVLTTALDANKKLTAEQIKTRESRYLLPVACGLYEQYDAAKALKAPPSDEYVKAELGRLAQAVLLVIDQDAII